LAEASSFLSVSLTRHRAVCCSVLLSSITQMREHRAAGSLSLTRMSIALCRFSG
jgi:hypothetical protein